jgi:DNA-binding LacI/PurR family transcriptional regulator
MSVVGFDGIQLSRTMPTSLTTISISGRELAQTCVKSMDYMRANLTKRGLLLTVGGTLVVRESTAVAPTRNRP